MEFKLVKRENASDLILILMISALMSLLVTRFLLYIFGWPTISFGVWHIAHVIWGGVFMIGGIILVLTNHGERARKLAAILGGAGWGLFIDEIGKYLTKNNDYWFQPAIIFIYVSFILLFLVYRYFEKNQPQDSKTLLYSVINQLEEIAENDLNESEKKQIITKLNRIINKEKHQTVKEFAIDLKGFIKKHQAKKDKRLNLWQQLLIKTGYYSYNKIFKRKFIRTGLAIFAGVWSLDKIWETIRILGNPQKLELIRKFYDDYNLIYKSDFYMIVLKIIFDSVTALLFLAGLFTYSRKKRIRGIRYFQLGLLVSIFLSSVFKLYFEQFSEVPILGMSILLLVAISKLRREMTA